MGASVINDHKTPCQQQKVEELCQQQDIAFIAIVAESLGDCSGTVPEVGHCSSLARQNGQEESEAIQ